MIWEGGGGGGGGGYRHTMRVSESVMILKYTMFIISSYMCLMETKQLDKIVESHVELHMELSRTGS